MKAIIKKVTHLSCPQLLCDVCGLPIEDFARAMVKWPEDRPSELITCHKGDCDKSIHEEVSWPWMELTTYLYDLMQNGKVDFEQTALLTDLLRQL